MAVDIKKMVDAICSLTVLELSKLVKALRYRFGLSTSDTNEVEDPDPDRVNGRAAENSNESDKSNSDSAPIEPEDKSSDEPVVDIKDVEEGEVPEGLTEPAEEPNEPEKESKPVPDPSFVDVPNSVDEPVYKSVDVPVYKPKGENYDLVYAWRYSGDKRYAKIGISTKHLLHTRMPRTYHPTDDPVLIGVFKCANRQHAEKVEDYILSGLKRTRSGHEWVEIDEAFNEMIDQTFISDPDMLREIFGTQIKTEKS